MLDPLSLWGLTLDRLTPVFERVIPLIETLFRRNPKLRNQIIWIVCVVVLLLVSAAAVFGFHAIWGSYKPGIAVAVFLWSVFLGSTAFVLLPNKLLITAFGTLLGMSISEAPSGAGLISAARKQVTAIASEIGIITNAPPGTIDPFISWMVWMFIGIAGLICLPAFFQTEEQKQAASAELVKPADKPPEKEPDKPADGGRS